MKDLAPDIFRQRLIMEGYWGINVDDGAVRDYLTGLAAAVAFRAKLWNIGAKMRVTTPSCR